MPFSKWQKQLRHVKTNGKHNLTRSVKTEEVCTVNTNNKQLDLSSSVEKYMCTYISNTNPIVNIVDQRGMWNLQRKHISKLSFRRRRLDSVWEQLAVKRVDNSTSKLNTATVSRAILHDCQEYNYS